MTAEICLMCYMTSYVINKCFTPASITKEEGLYLPEPTGMNSPVASIMYFDWAKLQPRSAFFLDSSLCPESLPGALHTRLDLRHPIPKLTRCSGQIVMSWILSGVWKQPLRARISSISVSQPLNWSCFWGSIYSLCMIPRVRFYATQSLTLDQPRILHRPKVRTYTPSLNIVSQRLRLTINSALFYFLEKFPVKISFSKRDL